MTWKRLETIRETRLWLTQVFVPVAAIAAAAMHIPEVHDAVITKVRHIKTKVKTMLDKK